MYNALTQGVELKFGGKLWRAKFLKAQYLLCESLSIPMKYENDCTRYHLLGT
jgi:hypothetical protein